MNIFYCPHGSPVFYFTHVGPPLRLWCLASSVFLAEYVLGSHFSGIQGENFCSKYTSLSLCNYRSPSTDWPLPSWPLPLSGVCLLPGSKVVTKGNHLSLAAVPSARDACQLSLPALSILLLYVIWWMEAKSPLQVRLLKISASIKVRNQTTLGFAQQYKVRYRVKKYYC